jgi:hypothetical protein
MMKKLMILMATLAMGLVAAIPAFAEVSFEVGDTANESGNISTENSFAIEGNNNNACLGLAQFDQSGNFTNQQGTLQYRSPADNLEFAGGELEFVPENATECEQEVQQAAAASSGGAK